MLLTDLAVRKLATTFTAVGHLVALWAKEQTHGSHQFTSLVTTSVDYRGVTSTKGQRVRYLRGG